MVRFDAISDARFLTSLEDLGTSAHLEVLATLDYIARNQYTWDRFVAAFNWRPLHLSGQDTFPGANELHEFIIQGPSSQLYNITGYTYETVVVVCAIGFASSAKYSVMSCSGASTSSMNDGERY